MPQLPTIAAEAMPWRTLFERYDRAMNEIDERKYRITSALAAGNVPYALIGGQAVIAWVTTVDPDAVRTTKDIDILLRRDDLPRAKDAAAAAESGNVRELFRRVDGPGRVVRIAEKGDLRPRRRGPFPGVARRQMIRIRQFPRRSQPTRPQRPTFRSRRVRW